ncbi:hypothetical protein CDL15_Pgr023536 [Punica granatum]|uniref:Uncharacterized protein n=1 Tax=Punica granatum TaxID=22663 RepID=A0A218W8P7_PUNGR|nr:hypothetical protein CDL15_Pgr023536 [Punica granatum]
MFRDIAARKRAPGINCELEEKRRVGGEFQIELREPRGPERKNRAAGRVCGGELQAVRAEGLGPSSSSGFPRACELRVFFFEFPFKT